MKDDTSDDDIMVIHITFCCYSITRKIIKSVDTTQARQDLNEFVLIIWDKVFKNGASEICRRQSKI